MIGSKNSFWRRFRTPNTFQNRENDKLTVKNSMKFFFSEIKRSSKGATRRQESKQTAARKTSR